MSKMRLMDLIDVESMQIIQRGFSLVTGIATAVLDENGDAISRSEKREKFCFGLIRATAAGEENCRECDRAGARRAMRRGEAVVYQCHAGLCDIAAPIVVDGRFLGALVGGQIVVEESSDEQLAERAGRLGIDVDAYLEAFHELPVRDKKSVANIAEYMNAVAQLMAVMAANRYEIIKKTREMENISRTKTEFLSTLNLNLYKPLQEMLFLANSINRMELPAEAALKLRTIEKQNQKAINALADAMTFSEMTRMDSDIVESRYDLIKLCEGLELTYTGKLLNSSVDFVLKIDEDVPTDLFGDVTRIRQILMNLLNNALQYTKQGMIGLHISKKQTTYGLILNFEIYDTGSGMNREQVRSIQEMFDEVHESQTINEDVLAFGLGMTSQLLNAVYGTIVVESVPGEGSHFLVSIPQMAAED